MKLDTTDNRWTTFAALAHAASSVIDTVVNARKHPANEPGLHERVALLERRLEDLEGTR